MLIRNAVLILLKVNIQLKASERERVRCSKSEGMYVWTPPVSCKFKKR